MPTLEFKGKPFVYSHHLSVPFRELIVDPKKSCPGGKKASLDDNLIIHGDNLEALKALLPRYAGKVDVIYIDPPYNTGNEGWAYNDAVNSPLMKQWLGKIVDRDDLERHDKWLCMMWPRLELLRELLSPSGAIFASIEDTEQAALLEIMREIFGNDRLLATLPIVNNLKGRNDKGNFARAHEYVVAFANPQFTLLGLPLTQKQAAAFKHKDERGELYAIRDMRKRGGADTREERPNLFYPVYFNAEGFGASLERTSKSAFKVLPMKSDGSEGCWKWGKEKAGANLSILSMSKGRQGSKGVGYRLYLNPDAQPGGPDVLDDEDAWDEEAEEPIERVAKPKSFWWGPELSTDGAGKQLKAIMQGAKDFSFEYPKPVALIERIVLMAAQKNGIILDSFAGSGTTAHAVLAANRRDGGSRKFILVETEDYADTLTAERVRRIIKGVPKAKDEALKKGFDGSFTYCELGDPIDLEKFFAGKGAPSYEQVARYVIFTATGASVADLPKGPRADWFAGEAGGFRVHLVYKPDLAFMRGNDAALTREMAQTVSKAAKGKKSGGDKPVLVYAAQKFLSQKELSELGITFCQLPYAVYRILGDAPDAA